MIRVGIMMEELERVKQSGRFWVGSGQGYSRRTDARGSKELNLSSGQRLCDQFLHTFLSPSFLKPHRLVERAGNQTFEFALMSEPPGFVSIVPISVSSLLAREFDFNAPLFTYGKG